MSTGITAAGVVEAAKEVSRWNANQVVVIGCALGMFVITGLFVWNQYENRNDRKDERQVLSQTVNTINRSSDEREENSRKFFTMMDERRTKEFIAMDEKRSKDTDARVKMLLDHCAASDAKNHERDRERDKIMVSLTAEIAKLSAIMKKDGPEEAVLLIPIALPKAPMPRRVYRN